MEDHLRQFVLNGKAIMSDDHKSRLGHHVFMQKQAASKYLADLLGRTAAARNLKFKSGRAMAIALGWGKEGQSLYSKYETRTPIPHHLIPQFCSIVGVSVEWLVANEGPGPAWVPVTPKKKTRQKKSKKPLRAA